MGVFIKNIGVISLLFGIVISVKIISISNVAV